MADSWIRKMKSQCVLTKRDRDTYEKTSDSDKKSVTKVILLAAYVLFHIDKLYGDSEKPLLGRRLKF